MLTPEQAMELGLIPNTSGGTTFAQQVKYRGYWIIIAYKTSVRLGSPDRGRPLNDVVQRFFSSDQMIKNEKSN